MGDLGQYFSVWEFKCRHCGLLPVLDDELVKRLDALRKMVGRPLTIVSGYRCPTSNKRVGGHPKSEHLWGRAVDIPAGYATTAQCKKAGFIGIGTKRSLVVHLDMRRSPGHPWELGKQVVFRED